MKDTKNKDKKINISFYDNEPLWVVTLILITTILSFFPILVLSDGGSWTFFSLLTLWLITYFFGFRTGLISSFLFCILKVVASYVSEVLIAGALTDPANADMARSSFIKGPNAFLLEYVCACTGFSVGGLLRSNLRTQKYILMNKIARSTADSGNGPLIQIIGDIEKENSASGLIVGYLISVFIMYVCFVAAAPYYDSYPAEYVTKFERFIYDLKYDGGYMLVEAATTVLLLSVPPVRDLIFKLKHIANNPKPDPSIDSF